MNDSLPPNHSSEVPNFESVVIELKRESETLRRLAEELDSGQKKIAELEDQCSNYRRLIYAWAAEKVSRQAPVPDKELTTLIAELDGRPFEKLAAELERIADGE